MAEACAPDEAFVTAIAMPVDRRIHSDSCRAARLHRRIGGRRGDDGSGAERESFVSAELDDGRRRNEGGKCWTR